MAAIRNVAISLHRLNNPTYIAEATRHVQRHPNCGFKMIA
jgi:hypothetical protein